MSATETRTGNYIEKYIESIMGEPGTSVSRDLSLNFKKLTEENTQLHPEEVYLNALAIATALEDVHLTELAVGQLQSLNLGPELIQEAKESAAIMGMLNTYYKFKSFLDPQVQEQYNRAGLRMQSLMKPVNGKERFEQMAFAVSVINGCPTCVSSHEKALVQLGVSQEKIHDIARLAAVAKGLHALKFVYKGK